MSDPLQFYNNLGTGKDIYNCCLKLAYLCEQKPNQPLIAIHQKKGTMQGIEIGKKWHYVMGVNSDEWKKNKHQ